MENESNMRPDERRKALVALVQNEKTVPIDELAQRLSVSRMTIHRDLDLLEKRGLLRKDRGYVTAESSLLFESNFHYRAQMDVAEKKVLAEKARTLIEPGSVVMIDDSTTTLMICDAIETLEHVTVISNSLAVCGKLRMFPNVQLVLAGGNYTDTLQGCYGIVCEQAISRLRADWAFLSASSVIGTALYHQDQDVVRMKRAMMTSSERTALLLTSSKFSVRALNYFSDMSEFDRIFISRNIDAESEQSLRRQGIPFETV